MRNQPTRALVLTSLCLALLASCGKAPPYRYVSTGNHASSAKTAISGAALVVRSGSPGVMFGTARRFTEQRDISYLVLFKVPASMGEGWSFSQSGEASVDSREAKCHDAVEINGRKIEVAHEFQFDMGKSEVTGEKLTVAGKIVEADKGLVFLIDLNIEPPKIEQVAADLPVGAAPEMEKKNVEDFAREILDKLMREQPLVRSFFQ